MRAVSERVSALGGRLLVVGGAARDRALGRELKDLDVEIFGLPAARLREILEGFGPTREVGRSFPVFLVDHWGIDFALAEAAEPVAAARGQAFEAQLGGAARRRDLTINAIAFDPRTDEWFDPLGGRADLERKLLRAADPARFAEDPLRGLRVARFAAVLGMTVDPALSELCAGLDLAAVPGERIFGELRRILLEAPRPSIALHFLRDVGLLRFLPELAATVDVPQDLRWHPEGCVFTHTAMVVDRAAELREEAEASDEDLDLMLGALCHDFGKPLVTTTEPDGRIRAISHSEAGVAPTEAFLARLRASEATTQRVAALVRHHLAPFEFARGKAGARAYRRLARRLGAAGASLDLLGRVARADALGRTTEDALAGLAPDCDLFDARAAEIGIARRAAPDAVQGRHLLARGFDAGPEIGDWLERCREVQDETGWSDPTRILDRVLGGEDSGSTTASVTDPSDNDASGGIASGRGPDESR